MIIATSGTAAALAEGERSGNMKSSGKAAAKVRGRKETSTRTVRKLADKLAKMNNGRRASIPGIGPRRSEIIVGGAQGLCRLPAGAVSVCGVFAAHRSGLRDGLLAQMLAETDLRASVHRQTGR